MTALLTGLCSFLVTLSCYGLASLRARLAAPAPNHQHCHLTQSSQWRPGAEAPEACLSASLHFFPGRLITKQDVTAAITRTDLEVTQIREGVFELHLAPCRTRPRFFRCDRHACKLVRQAWRHHATRRTAHRTQYRQNDLKKKARFYALSAKDELIIDRQVQDALVSVGWADEEIIQPFQSTLISDDQLYSFRFD